MNDNVRRTFAGLIHLQYYLNWRNQKKIILLTIKQMILLKQTANAAKTISWYMHYNLAV